MNWRGGFWPQILSAFVLCLGVVATPVCVVAASSATDVSAPLAVINLRSGLTPGRSRIVVDLDDAPVYTVSTRTAPERIVVEIQNAALNTIITPELFQGTPVAKFYTEQTEANNLRLVLELEQAVARVDGFYLQPWSESEHHRVVVDIYTNPVDGDSIIELADVSGAAPQTVPVGHSSVSRETGRRERASVANSSPLRTGAQAQEKGAEMSSRHAETGLDLQFSGTVQQEWAYSAVPHQHQKFETLFTPRLDMALENVTITAVGRIRLDAVGDLGPAERHPPNYSNASRPWYNSERVHVELRELYADFQVGDSDWRIGKQQVVWGQADGIKVLDVVNPQSFREFILDDFDESRIPLWMANINLPVGDAGNLQLLWIPDTTSHELAELGSPYAARSPRLIPPLPVSVIADTAVPDNPWSDGDYGLQFGAFHNGWDLTLNYIYHYVDTPALPVRSLPSGALILAPTYYRSHLLGGTASTTVGGVTVRSELAYSTDTFQPLGTLRDEAVGDTPELSTVLGFDWMPNADSLYSAQWFYSYLSDHDDAMARDASEHLLTVLYQQDFSNAVWRLRALGIYSPNDGDSLLQLSLSYWILGNLKVWAGADVFSGSNRGLFGQYSAEDRLLLGLEYGF